MSESSASNRRTAWLVFFLTAFVAFAVDLSSKYVAFNHPTYKLLDGLVRDEVQQRWVPIGTDAREVRVWPGYFHFRATVNEGAVFGLGQGRRPVFIVVSSVAFVFLMYLLTRAEARFDQILLGLLLAGVLGNMYDRVVYGYVRDMLFAGPDVRWPGSWTLPLIGYPGVGERLVFPWIFNVADVLLCCGVGVLMIRNVLADLKRSKSDKTGNESKAAANP
jgi:signal peptidase II